MLAEIVALDAAERLVANHKSALTFGLLHGHGELGHWKRLDGIGIQRFECLLQMADVAFAELGHASKHVWPIVDAVGEDLLEISGVELGAHAFQVRRHPALVAHLRLRTFEKFIQADFDAAFAVALMAGVAIEGSQSLVDLFLVRNGLRDRHEAGYQACTLARTEIEAWRFSVWCFREASGSYFQLGEFRCIHRRLDFAAAQVQAMA